MTSRNLAVITARGGSRRIPGKNIRPFCGRPIITYSIAAARESGLFDTVMVSTDDRSIAEIAREAGAEVPFLRSAETSDDFSTTSDVLMEVLREYMRRSSDPARGEVCPYDIACCLYPTAPFVTPSRLREGMQLLLGDPEADTVLPVVPFSFPPQRGVYIEENRIVLADPESYPKRSQDLRKMYHDCGQFYLFRTAPFLASGKLIGDHVIPLPMSELEVQDIDSETDWQLAEMKYRLLHG